MPTPNTPLPEYENIFGTKKVMVVDHAGPASYPEGGETISAKDFGWGGIDFAFIGSGPLTGVDVGTVYYGVPLFSGVGAQEQMKLAWFQGDLTANGEVTPGTDLSGVTVRLMLIGV